MEILYKFLSNRNTISIVLMSQVYTSILRPVIATFDLSVFKNLHCDEKSSMFIYCIIYLIFVYLIDFIQPIRQVLEFRSISSPIDNVFCSRC